MKLCNRLLLHSWTTRCNGSNNDDKERGQRPPNPSSKRKKTKKKKRETKSKPNYRIRFVPTPVTNIRCFDVYIPPELVVSRFNVEGPVTFHERKGEGDVLKRNGQRYFADVRLKGWRYRCVACWKRVIKSDNALYRNATLFFPFFFNYGGINPPPGVKARREPWMKAERLNFTSLKRVGRRGEGRGGEKRAESSEIW